MLVLLLARPIRQSGVHRCARRCGADLAATAPPPGGPAAHLHAAATRLSRRWRRLYRRTNNDAGDLANMLDDIARRCASGQSLTSAFSTTSATQTHVEAVAPVRVALASGSSIDDALSMATPADADGQFAIHVLRLCARQGGNIAESLDRAAGTLRERATVRSERSAQAAQARLSAKVLTVVPIAFAGWTLLTTPSVQEFATTPFGLVCCSAGIGLNVTGWTLMNRAIRGRD